MPVLIYGKDGCPYTSAAREDHSQRKIAFEYVNVVADPARSVAARYALPHGGLAVIRPDGYLGLVGGLDADVAEYFSKIVG